MELDARLVRLPALLHLEDLDLVAVLQTAGLGDVLLVEASAVEGEADVLFADALPLAVGSHHTMPIHRSTSCFGRAPPRNAECRVVLQTCCIMLIESKLTQN